MALTDEDVKKYNALAKAESETELKVEMITPAAKSAEQRKEIIEIDGKKYTQLVDDDCPEIMLKDLRLGNLSEKEINIANEGIGLLHLLRYITKNSELNLSNTYRYFYNDIIAPIHISNSREGYLEQLMVTRKLETKQEQTLAEIAQQPPQKKGLLGFKR